MPRFKSRTENLNKPTIEEDIILCQNCFNIPLIKMKFECDVNLVVAKCPTCKFVKEYSIKEYLEEIEDLRKEILYCSSHRYERAIEFCLECHKLLCLECIPKHRELNKSHQKVYTASDSVIETSCLEDGKKPFKYFCFDCNKNMCQFCNIDLHPFSDKDQLLKSFEFLCEDCDADLSQYFTDDAYKLKKHKMLNLTDIVKKINEHLLYNNYTQWREYLNNTLPNLKNKYIKNKSANPYELNQYYEEFKEKNTEFLDFFKIIMRNFSKIFPNYFQIQNFIHFSKYKMNMFVSSDPEGKDYDQFLKYLKNAFGNAFIEGESIYADVLKGTDTIFEAGDLDEEEDDSSNVNINIDTTKLRNKRKNKGKNRSNDEGNSEDYEEGNESEDENENVNENENEQEEEEDVINLEMLKFAKKPVSSQLEKSNFFFKEEEDDESETENKFEYGGDIVDISHMKNLKTITDNTKLIYTLIQLDDGRFVSCSSDNSIKIYNSTKMALLHSFDNSHDSTVTYICQLPGSGYLVSCSEDRRLKLWDITEDNYKLVKVLENAHHKYVFKIIPVSEERFATCSDGTTIKIWEDKAPDFKCLSKLTGHISWVVSIIQVKNELLVSGSYFDKVLKFWDLNKYKCIHTLKDVTVSYRNSLLEISENKLLVGAFNQCVVVDCNSFSIDRVIKFPNEELDSINCFAVLRDFSILCGCSNGYVYNLDLKKMEFRNAKMKCHGRDINSLECLNDHIIASCSDDKSIKIFKY